MSKPRLILLPHHIAFEYTDIANRPDGTQDPRDLPPIKIGPFAANADTISNLALMVEQRLHGVQCKVVSPLGGFPNLPENINLMYTNVCNLLWTAYKV